jgi:KUP system potassium uptake protein
MFGLAVSATMLATDIIFFVVATRVLRWPRAFVYPFTALFAALDATFFLAGLPKFIDGAWVPLVVAAVITIVSITWLNGRRAVVRSLAAGQQPVEAFLKSQEHLDAPAADGTVVFLTGDPTGVPFVANHRWLRPIVAQERLVLLTITPVPIPYVDDGTRVHIDRVNQRFVRVSAKFGYMERPTLAPILHQCARETLDIDNAHTSVVYANPVVVAQGAGGLPRWQRILFTWLQRNARTLATELDIPPERRVELSVDTPV